jgi:aldehyde dehydrogenase (NAD+)
MCTRDVSKAFKAMERITAGIVYINVGTVGAEVHLPFAGTRGTDSGHREEGQVALDSYAEWKTVYIDYSGHLQKAEIGEEWLGWARGGAARAGGRRRPR